MLIRVSGAISGIKEYLEKGRKDGRENTRDELDQRLILDGDLELTDEIINRMDNSGERYLHITLSFKEDEISHEAMREIIADFKYFAMTAYEADEYNFYAEAHYPKIKSYTHKATGEFIERKPHIHVVIPQSNLLTGLKMNPLGRVEQQTKFLDAFQEHVNHKYGLASPKDHRRTEITSASEMISRYKGDIFEGNNRELKQRLLSEVLDKKIVRYEDFKAMLVDHGVTRARNAGKESEYQNVKPEGQARGVNLKEFVFSREFVELSVDAKRARLAEDARHQYDAAKDPRPTPAEISDRLEEWHNVRAKEVKYLNSGNKKFYAHYKDSTTEQRRDLLKDREQRFYEKHRKEVDHGRSNRKPDINAVGREAPPIARTRLRSLSELDVVRDAKRSEMLLPSDVSHKLADQRADADRGVRRADDRTGGGSDSVTGQLLKDVSERRNQRLGASDELTEIRSKLDARRLLAHVSRTHGVIPEKYAITKAKDGTDRIKCGTRNLSTSDFLTKEMNLPWKEAAPILRDSYAEQLGREPRRERHAPKRELWAEYRNDWKPKQQAAKTNESQAQRDSEKTRRADIRNDFYSQRSTLQSNRKLTKAARKAALSVARMEKVVKEAKLREAIKIERRVLKEKYQKPPSEQYCDYLAEKVDHGSEDALTELRRQRTERVTDEETQNRYRPHQQDARQDVAPIMSRMAYTVARNGDVTYNDEQGRATLKDVGHEVRLLKDDDKTIETGLRFAMQKFGKTIDMTGDSEFKKRTVEVAVARGIDVDFSDREAKQYYAALKHQQEIDKQHQALGKEFFKQQKEAQTTKPAQQKDRDRERVRTSSERAILTPKIDDRER